MKHRPLLLPLPVTGTLNKQPFAKSSEAADTTSDHSFWFAGMRCFHARAWTAAGTDVTTSFTPPRERPLHGRQSRVDSHGIGLLVVLIGLPRSQRVTTPLKVRSA